MLYNHNSSACLNTFQSRYMAPPDPAGLDEQGRDQKSVHVEVWLEKEQVEDPSCDGLYDVEQPEASGEAWGEEGGLDDVEQQEAPEEAWGEEGGLDGEAEQAPQDQQQAEAWVLILKPSPPCH